MQPLMVILLCCLVGYLLGSGQFMVCKTKDQNCSSAFGCLWCIVCCGSIIYILSGQAQ